MKLHPNAASTAQDEDPRFDVTTPLVPGNAVAGLITIGDRYLLQLRDNKHGIFFPARWGCFGGALDIGEAEEMALARELHEEIGIELSPTLFRYFSRIVSDYSFVGHGHVSRSFYEVELTTRQFDHLCLREGAAMQTFDVKEILTGAMPLTPTDGYALWLHINRARLRP